MLSVDILSLLSGLNPTFSEIESLFMAFTKAPTNIIQVLLKTVDEQMLIKLAKWSTAFAQHLNDVGTPVDPSQGGVPNPSSSFMDVMNGTTFVGAKLTPQDLEIATNIATSAIKANNWEQAIWVGITLGKMLPVAI